jgi:hypothetical protein
MPKALEYYTDLAEDLVDNPDNSKSRDMWRKIDNMVACDGVIPANIREKEWIGEAKFFHSLPHDIVAGTKTFLASRLPIITATPMRYDEEAHSKMEYLETALDWHYACMNKRGKLPVQIQIVEDAVKYMAVAFQTEYMPFEAKRSNGKDPLYSAAEVREMRRLGDFRWLRHHPLNVYPVYGNDVLKKVLRVGVYSYYGLMQEYGEDVVKSAIADHFKETPSASDLRNTYASCFDVTDGKDRIVWFTHNGSSTSLETGADKPHEILRAERKVTFIPWVIENYGTPLMEGIVNSGIYDHLAVMDIIQYSGWLSIADEPGTIVNSPDKNNPDLVVDGDGPSAIVYAGSQTSMQRLQKHQIDPQWMQLRGMLENQLRSSAKAEAVVNLANAVGGAAQVGTINMYQSTAIAQLADVINIAERAISSGLHQMVQWIYESKEPLLGYRRAEKDNTPFGRQGAQVYVDSAMNYDQTIQTPQDMVYVDPMYTHVEVELQPTTVQDRQAILNQTLLEQQVGISKSTSLEKLVQNPKIEIERSIQEAYETNFVKLDMMKDEAQAQAQIIIQQAQQQAQQIMQQAQQGGIPPSQQTQAQQANAGAQYASTQGMDSRTGGNSPAQVVPNETRNTVNGTTDTGQPLS